MLGDLPPSSSVDPLQRAAGLGADLPADLGRAGEGDLVDARMIDQRRPGLAVAGEDVDDPGRNPGLERQLAEPQRGERRLLGRLEHRPCSRPPAPGASFHAAISSGKFQGMICAHTPTGSLRV